MKVFISWSGKLSEKLGEALRDWLPCVLQSIDPYFTPNDIEKGSKWGESISKELSSSSIGILCITKENIHSDWMLFEAGALSKSLDKSHVCPILFGVTNTDLVGPLGQFQTTAFNKKEVRKLLSVINDRLESKKVNAKTFDMIFEKWWHDIESKINKIMEDHNDEGDGKPMRDDRELLEEILILTRKASKQRIYERLSEGTLKEIARDLVKSHLMLHESQKGCKSDYQETLNILREYQKEPLDSLLKVLNQRSEPLENLDYFLEEENEVNEGYQDIDYQEVPF